MAFTASLRITGIDAVLRRAGVGLERYKQAGGRALFAKANRIMADSKPLVPVDTGALRSSGFVAPPIVSGRTIIVVMGYGGAAAPYAVRQHEDTSLVHRTGQAKFLEQPLRQHVPTFVPDISRDIAKDLK